MKKFLTLLEIFNSYESEQIIRAILELYPEQETNVEGYKRMLAELRDINPNPNPQTMRIQVYQVYQEWDFQDEPDDYISVHGIDPKAELCEFTGCSGEDIGWAIEYSPWADWLSWEVECICTEDPRCDSFLKVLAHIIWEMTWAGFSQEKVQARSDEIFEVDKSVKDGTAELIPSSGCVFDDLGIEKPEDL